MGKKKAYDATDAELAVLKLLWERGECTARQIQQVLYPRRTDSDQATVQKLLQRLEAKGLVKRDRRQFAHRFTAKVDRSQMAGRQLRKVAEKLSDGSLVPLLINLIESKALRPQERAEIRRLLEQADDASSERET